MRWYVAEVSKGFMVFAPEIDRPFTVAFVDVVQAIVSTAPVNFAAATAQKYQSEFPPQIRDCKACLVFQVRDPPEIFSA